MQADNVEQTRYGLVRDMLAVPDIIRKFDSRRMEETAREIKSVGRLLLTGEGSSRIFPAKSMIARAMEHGGQVKLHTEAGLQAQQYALAHWAVFALSNSGRTAEVIGLFEQLAAQGHRCRYSLTAFADSKLESLASRGYVLECGEEGAVAATKSVIEQALFYHALLEHMEGRPTLHERLPAVADAVAAALTTPLDPTIIDRIAKARTICWAGRNDGVAEELTLKTNEITRKPADFLEGTYAVHGIEEVLDADDVVIWIDPFPGSEQKFHDVLVKGIGLEVIAIAHRPTQFPTILLPDVGTLNSFVQMAGGWNVLVDVGLALGIDVDKPVRARKVGNEFTG
ncbi:MAG: SIS domain-containing protein [Planctomycetaceae bacterium]